MQQSAGGREDEVAKRPLLLRRVMSTLRKSKTRRNSLCIDIRIVDWHGRMIAMTHSRSMILDC